jgi:SAM-dependent methyltransferase
VTEESAYILGTDAVELERLRFQHHAWRKEAYALWELAGIGRGHVVADLGCGPGFATLDLAAIVGPEGRVIGRDASGRFLGHLVAEAERLGLAQVETSLGPIEELDLAPGRLDAAYARWLLCWLPDPGAALERVRRALAPGGVLALQDYIDWGAMKLVPPSPVFARAVAACLRSWELGGGTIDVGEHVPALAAERGFRVELLRPLARLGRVGSLEWGWLGQFFESYLPKLVPRGLLAAEELDAFRLDWSARTEAGASWCYTPTMVDVLLRAP